MRKDKIGIIILAAGESKRLGRAKQLLEIQGKTLIERIIETALKTNFQTTIVLGAKAEKIQPKIEKMSVEIVVNENWQNGMSSSIVCGLSKLLETQKDLSAIVILLCDQPFVSTEAILQLIEKQRLAQKKIVASEYENTFGVPALFTKEIFDELLNLDKKVGAKSIIKKYAETDLAKISVPEAEFDIDTEEDFREIAKNEK